MAFDLGDKIDIDLQVWLVWCMRTKRKVGNRAGLSVCVLSNVDVIELKTKPNMTFEQNLIWCWIQSIFQTTTIKELPILSGAKHEAMQNLYKYLCEHKCK